MKRLTSGATEPTSASTGVISSARPPRRSIVGLSSRRNGGSQPDRLLQRGAALGGRLAATLGVLMKPVTLLRSRASGASTRSSRGRGRPAPVLAGQDLHDPVGLLQRRVGVADRLAQRLALAGEARPQLVEDDRQPLAVGQAEGVDDQVGVDRLARLLDRDEALALAVPSVRDPAQRRQRLARRPRLRQRALDELVADERLRADRALRVAAEVLKPRRRCAG